MLSTSDADSNFSKCIDAMNRYLRTASNKSPFFNMKDRLYIRGTQGVYCLAKTSMATGGFGEVFLAYKYP